MGYYCCYPNDKKKEKDEMIFPIDNFEEKEEIDYKN